MENYEISNYEARKAALTKEIIAAFDGVSREGGVSMLEARVIDDGGSDEARMAARARDTETRWQDVPDEKIGGGNGHEALSFLDPIGFHYYLPAYIVWYLQKMDSDWDSNTLSHVDFSLASTYGNRERFEMLSPIQAKAVAHFLEFQAERNDAWDLEIEQFQAESEINEEFEEWRANNARKEAEKLASMSSEEIEERESEREQRRAQHNSPDNDARDALEKYWGRFL